MDPQNWPIALGDLLVVTILLLSSALAFARGFVREILAIAGWVGAAFVTLYTFHAARDYVRTYIEMELLADVITGVGIFVLSLVVFSLISYYVGRLIRGSGLNAVDRSMGFLFGLARGGVVICLGYLLLVWLFPEREEMPAWVTEARSEMLVARGAVVLVGLVPDRAFAEGSRRAETLRGEGMSGSQSLEELRRFRTIPTPEDGSERRTDPDDADSVAQDRDTGYNRQARERLEQLIEFGR